MPAYQGGEPDRDEWRGMIGAKVAHIQDGLAQLKLAVEALRHEMLVDHETIRTHLAARDVAIDKRFAPLEQLRYIGVGIFLACLVIVPIIWTYTSKVETLLTRAGKVDMILDRVDKILPPAPKP